MEWHEDLENVCQQAGLKGKKLSKVFYFSKTAILIILSSYFPMAIIISSKLENLFYFERLITINFNKFLMVCSVSEGNLETWVELCYFFLFAGNGKLLLEYQSVEGTSRSPEPSKERRPRILKTSQSYFSSPDLVVLITLLSCSLLVCLFISLSVYPFVCEL